MRLVEHVILVMKPLALSFPETLAISMCDCYLTICKRGALMIRLSGTNSLSSKSLGGGCHRLHPYFLQSWDLCHMPPVMRVKDIYPELPQHMPTLSLKNSFGIITSIMPNLHECVTKEKVTHEKTSPPQGTKSPASPFLRD